jgi:hypothetical protein
MQFVVEGETGSTTAAS